MSLRDFIKANMKTEQQISEEKAQEEHEHIEFIKRMAINEFESHIIGKARSGVKGNTVTGTYNMGRAVVSYRANQRVIGQHKRRLLSKYTFWKYTFDLKSDEMIRLEAIKKYASEENISITLGLVPCLRDRRGIEFDLSDFPTVTAISHGKHYGGSLLELDMADFSLMVHYSVSI